MSDCHRGDGSWADNFSKNRNIYFAALSYYYNENYTYIEIGDGDELWENNQFASIFYAHSDVFLLLAKFFNKGKLYFIFGNHDMVKKDNKFVKENLYEYFEEREKKYIPLFKNIKLHEGLVLRHKDTDQKIFLIHGHQVDFFNSTLWKLARFLARYVWRPLELFGVNDPTSTAKNYKRKELVEKGLLEWVKKEKHLVVSGHTHRPMFAEVGEPPYFNAGSSVHPQAITGIEIVGGNMMLVKWEVKTKKDDTLFIGRDILAGPIKLTDFNKKLAKE